MSRNQAENAVLSQLIAEAAHVQEGAVWPYSEMNSIANFRVQRHRPLLAKVRAALERTGYFFIVKNNIGWQRCTARDMLLWDAKEHLSAARKAKRAVARLTAINPLLLSEAERGGLFRKIGLWQTVRMEHEREAATILFKTKRMRKQKPHPIHPIIELPDPGYEQFANP